MARPINSIASEIFKVPDESLGLETTPDDVDTWDSLNHMRLITAIETEYGLRFSMQQIRSIKSLADFQTMIPAIAESSG